YSNVVNIMYYLYSKRIENMIELEKVLKEAGLSRPILEKVKKYGFSDIQIARVLGKSEIDVYNYRMQETLMPVYKKVDTCAGQFESTAKYFYSTYEMVNESVQLDKKKVLVFGSGPIRIDQCIEFEFETVNSVI